MCIRVEIKTRVVGNFELTKKRVNHFFKYYIIYFDLKSIAWVFIRHLFSADIKPRTDDTAAELSISLWDDNNNNLGLMRIQSFVTINKPVKFRFRLDIDIPRYRERANNIALYSS